jgi:uncharacterized membrane protein YgcG
MSRVTKTLIAMLTAMLVGGAAYVAAAPGGHDAVAPAADVKGHAPQEKQANVATHRHDVAGVRDRADNEAADENDPAENEPEDVNDTQENEVEHHENLGPGSLNSGPGNARDRGEQEVDNSGPGSMDSGRDGGDSGSSGSGSGDSGSGGHGSD